LFDLNVELTNMSRCESHGNRPRAGRGEPPKFRSNLSPADEVEEDLDASEVTKLEEPGEPVAFELEEDDRPQRDVTVVNSDITRQSVYDQSVYDSKPSGSNQSVLKKPEERQNKRAVFRRHPIGICLNRLKCELPVIVAKNGDNRPTAHLSDLVYSFEDEEDVDVVKVEEEDVDVVKVKEEEDVDVVKVEEEDVDVVKVEEEDVDVVKVDSPLDSASEHPHSAMQDCTVTGAEDECSLMFDNQLVMPSGTDDSIASPAPIQDTREELYTHKKIVIPPFNIGDDITDITEEMVEIYDHLYNKPDVIQSLGKSNTQAPGVVAPYGNDYEFDMSILDEAGPEEDLQRNSTIEHQYPAMQDCTVVGEEDECTPMYENHQRETSEDDGHYDCSEERLLWYDDLKPDVVRDALDEAACEPQHLRVLASRGNDYEFDVSLLDDEGDYDIIDEHAAEGNSTYVDSLGSIFTKDDDEAYMNNGGEYVKEGEYYFSKPSVSQVKQEQSFEHVNPVIENKANASEIEKNCNIVPNGESKVELGTGKHKHMDASKPNFILKSIESFEKVVKLIFNPNAQVNEDVDPINTPNMDIVSYNREAKASEIVDNDQVIEDVDPIDKPDRDLLQYNREAEASETVEDNPKPVALESFEDGPNPVASKTVEDSPNPAASETKDSPNPAACETVQDGPKPATSETVEDKTSEQDKFHEVIGFTSSYQHEDYERITNPSNSDTHNKRTLFTSNIQMASGSSGVNFDIAVEKTCPQEESHTSELGNAEITSTINVQSIRNRRNGQNQRSDKSARSRHFTFQRDGRISFNDILQTTLAFIDVVFWLIVAMGLIIYEICRGESIESMINPVLSPNERPPTPPPAPE